MSSVDKVALKAAVESYVGIYSIVEGKLCTFQAKFFSVFMAEAIMFFLRKISFSLIIGLAGWSLYFSSSQAPDDSLLYSFGALV